MYLNEYQKNKCHAIEHKSPGKTLNKEKYRDILIPPKPLILDMRALAQNKRIDSFTYQLCVERGNDSLQSDFINLDMLEIFTYCDNIKLT